MYAYMFFDDGCDSADVVLITVQVKAHAVRQAVDSFLNTPPTSADNKPVVKWLRSVNILCVMYRLLIVYRPCKLHSAALIVTPNSLYCGVFLPSCCPANPGVRVSGLAHQSHERTVELARECPAPCSPDHRWQHLVRRSLSFV